jgi:hypothetical protein
VTISGEHIKGINETQIVRSDGMEMAAKSDRPEWGRMTVTIMIETLSFLIVSI